MRIPTLQRKYAACGPLDDFLWCRTAEIWNTGSDPVPCLAWTIRDALAQHL